MTDAELDARVLALSDADLTALAEDHMDVWDLHWRRPRPLRVAMAREVLRLRAVIRSHRDQRGDDKCWRDDETLYTILPEGYTPPERDTLVELDNCERYIVCRMNPATIYVSPQRRIEELEAEVAALRADACGVMHAEVEARFSPARPPTENERHLLSLLSWRESENKSLKEEISRRAEKPT